MGQASPQWPQSSRGGAAQGTHRPSGLRAAEGVLHRARTPNEACCCDHRQLLAKRPSASSCSSRACQPPSAAPSPMLWPWLTHSRPLGPAAAQQHLRCTSSQPGLLQQHPPPLSSSGSSSGTLRHPTHPRLQQRTRMLTPGLLSPRQALARSPPSPPRQLLAHGVMSAWRARTQAS